MELKKLFDFTCNEGNLLKYLNIRIIQSPCGISLDQMQHITSTILNEYFQGVPVSSIPFKSYPFPIEPAFERSLYEAPPLVGPALQAKKKDFGFTYSHIVGVLCILQVSLGLISFMRPCIFQAIWLAQISQSSMPFIVPCVTYTTTNTSQSCTPENLSRKVVRC
jgi:hypothetical protein